MGCEDEVVCMYAQSQLDDAVASVDRVFCPKMMQVSLTGKEALLLIG